MSTLIILGIIFGSALSYTGLAITLHALLVAKFDWQASDCPGVFASFWILSLPLRGVCLGICAIANGVEHLSDEIQYKLEPEYTDRHRFREEQARKALPKARVVP